MSVPHARATAVTSTDEHAAGQVPGLLEVLAQVPDPRKRRGRRYLLVPVLAVTAACMLAGAKNFREIGDQAADLPQEVQRRLGGTRHPLRRTIIAPSQKRRRSGGAGRPGRRWPSATCTGRPRSPERSGHCSMLTGRPEGWLPKNCPLWVPLMTTRMATRSPSATMSASSA
jgi:hypothetical protein